MKHSNRGGAAAKRNTLICAIPGIRNPVEVAFQSRKLPVCKKCKKIYKTRDLCRVRDQHTDLPWNTTYLCFLVDESCLVNSDGKFMMHQEQQQYYASFAGDASRAGRGGHEYDADDDGNYIAETINIPASNSTMCLNVHDDETFLLQQQLKNFRITLDKLGPNPPICHDCKEKNYTRQYCRIHHSHTHLPWNTTYAWLKKRPDENIHTPGANIPGTVDTIYNSTSRNTTRRVDCHPAGNIPMDFIVEHQSSCDDASKQNLDANRTAAIGRCTSTSDAYNHLKREWSAFELGEENPSPSSKKSKRTETDIHGKYGVSSVVKGGSDNATIGNRNARMAFLLVIHEGNLTLHVSAPFVSAFD